MVKNKNFYKVYRLISNLSSSERSYIKRQLESDGKDKRIYILYHTLISLETYDENIIRESFKDFSKANFIIHNLVRTIAKMLQYYSQDEIIKVKLLNLAAQAEILESKNCFDLAKDIVDEGWELSHTYGSIVSKIVFSIWYINAYIREPDISLDEDIQKKYGELIQNISEVKSAFKPVLMHTLLFNLEKKYLTPIDGIQTLQLNFEYDTNNESENSMIIFIYSYYKYFSGEWEIAYEKIKELFEKLETENLEASISPRIQFLRVILQYSLLLYKHEEYEYYASKAQEFIELNRSLKGSSIHIKDIYVTMRLHYYSQLNKNMDSTLVEQVEQLVADIAVLSRLDYYIVLLSYYFFNSEYTKVSLQIIREANNPEFRNYPKNFVYIIRWIEMICYFETKEQSLFISRMGVLRRYIEKHRPLHEFEKLIMDFLRKNIDKNEDVKQLQLFYDILQGYRNQIRSSFSFFDIFRWIKVKIEKIKEKPWYN